MCFLQGGRGRGEEEGKKNLLGRHRDRLKIFDLGQFQR